MVLIDFLITGIALIACLGLYLLVRARNTSRANPYYNWIYGSLGLMLLIGVASPLIVYLLRIANVENGDLLEKTLAGALLFTLALVILLCVFMGGIFDQRLRQMLSGDYWVRWSYSPQEQTAFAESEVSRQSHNAGKYAMYSLIFAVVFGVMFGLIGTGSGHGLQIGAMSAGIVLGAGALLVVITYLDALSKEVRLLEGKEQQGGEGIINATGMYLFGRYFPFSGFNLWLDQVSLQEGNPPELKFRTLSRTRYGTTPNEIRLPIPDGKLEEARGLVDKFKAGMNKV